MGIRINKQMGWIWVGQELDISALDRLTLQDLKKEFKNNYELIHLDLMYPDLKPTTPLKNFVKKIQLEFDKKTYFVFIPPFVGRDWYRNDDSLDYYASSKIPKTSVKYISGNIFPYSKNFIVTNTGKELSSLQSQLCFDLNKTAETVSVKLKKELTSFGLNLKKPLSHQIHLAAPVVLRLLLKKCGSPEFTKLRPGIITYWS